MKFIRTVLEELGSGSIGFCIGALLVVFTLSQHPVVSLIIDHESNNVAARFSVVCVMMQDAQVKCHREQKPSDANENSDLSKEITNETF